MCKEKLFLKRKKTFLQSNNFCLELQIFIHKFIVSLAQTVGMCAVLVLTCSPGRSELQMDWLPLREAPCVCVATPRVTKHVWSSLASHTACRASPKPTSVSEQDLIANVVAVAENTADELARSDGREVRLEEDPDLQLPFLLPEDGYSCDVVRNVPSGLQEFLDPLCQRGGSPSQPGRLHSLRDSGPRARCVLTYVRPPHVCTPGALLGRSGPGEWRDAVGGDVGSEPGIVRPPGASAHWPWRCPLSSSVCAWGSVRPVCRCHPSRAGSSRARQAPSLPSL